MSKHRPKGMEPVRCTAVVKRTGEQCRRWARPGLVVCRMHGASAPQSKAAADRRVEEFRVRRDAMRQLKRILPVTDADPLQSLLEQLCLAAGWERYLRGEVEGLDGLETAGIGGSRKAVVAVELWNEERDRVSKYAKLALDAGLGERQVRLAEQQGAVIADVLRKVLDDPDLGLSDGQRRSAGQIAARHLRLAVAS